MRHSARPRRRKLPPLLCCPLLACLLPVTETSFSVQKALWAVCEPYIEKVRLYLPSAAGPPALFFNAPSKSSVVGTLAKAGAANSRARPTRARSQRLGAEWLTECARMIHSRLTVQGALGRSASQP